MAEIVLAEGWVLTGARVTLLVAFTLVSTAVLVTGIVVDGHLAPRQPGWRALGALDYLGLVLSALVRVTRTGSWQWPAGTDGSCRTEGILLDRHQVCVEIHDTQHRITLTLERSDSSYASS